ncbi:hypothetical protein Tco_0981547, partial [Tanacetum coccineum]
IYTHGVDGRLQGRIEFWYKNNCMDKSRKALRVLDTCEEKNKVCLDIFSKKSGASYGVNNVFPSNPAESSLLNSSASFKEIGEVCSSNVDTIGGASCSSMTIEDAKGESHEYELVVQQNW